MAKIETLRDLLIDELMDLYNAEQQLVKALPKMANAANNEDLKDGFTEHLAQTEGHVERLEQVFGLLEAPVKGKKCKAMEGLIAEGEEKIDEDASATLKDAALICAAQKVEHYEIAGYGTVRTFAEVLGYDDIVSILQETLDEESETDETLTAIASSINAELQP